MKRMVTSGLLLSAGTLSAWAQGGAAAADNGGSAGSMFGWAAAVIGLIVVLVVIARRLSTGEAWKHEIPIIVVGALLLNIGIWRVWATKQDDLEKTNHSLQNKCQFAQRQAQELQAANDKLQQENAQWKQRDQEFQKLIEDWKTYLAGLQKRIEASKAGPVRVAPIGKKSTTKDGGTKTQSGSHKTVPKSNP